MQYTAERRPASEKRHRGPVKRSNAVSAHPTPTPTQMLHYEFFEAYASKTLINLVDPRNLMNPSNLMNPVSLMHHASPMSSMDIMNLMNRMNFMIFFLFSL